MNHRRLLPWLFPAVSLGLWGFLVGAYATRADAVALVTMVPVWCWLVPGALLAGVRPKRRRVRGLWGLWLLFALVFVDELRPLYHPLRWLSAPKPSEKRLGVVRVVSLNCAGGDPKAAAEVSAWQPDVVLLQEIPNPAAVRALAKRLFGREDACVLSFDTAVLARELTPIALPPALQRSVAAAQTPYGRFVSVRLSPSVLQLDAKAQTQSRRVRHTELEDALIALPVVGTVVFGGDLNVPAGDGALQGLARRGLADAWPKAGLGWGNTIANDFPIHRIDQLWFRGLTPRALIAVPTQHSDHRMVVCDLAAD